MRGPAQLASSGTWLSGEPCWGVSAAPGPLLTLARDSDRPNYLYSWHWALPLSAQGSPSPAPEAPPIPCTHTSQAKSPPASSVPPPPSPPFPQSGAVLTPTPPHLPLAQRPGRGPMGPGSPVSREAGGPGPHLPEPSLVGCLHRGRWGTQEAGTVPDATAQPLVGTQVTNTPPGPTATPSSLRPAA